DEEGEGVLDEKQEEVLATDNRSDVTPQEQRQLAETETMQTDDDRNIQKARLDNEDFEGEPLNESIRQDGKDLDVPGEEMDDENEAKGEEDEESNEYSTNDN